MMTDSSKESHTEKIRRPKPFSISLGLLLFSTCFLFTSCEERLYDCTRHDGDGNLKSIVPCDKNGTYQGEYLEYHKTGKLWERRYYVDGLQEDTTRLFFYKTGETLMEFPMVNDKRHGMVRKFREDGSVEFQQEWSEGQKHGEHTIFYENGTPREVTTYKDGAQTGAYRFYSEDSSLIVSGEYHRGAKYGTWSHHDDDGTLLATISWYNNLKEGPFKVFRENGDAYVAGEFKEDYLEGEVSYLTADGAVSRTERYRKGMNQSGRASRFRNGRAIFSLGGPKTAYIMPDTVWINH